MDENAIMEDGNMDENAIIMEDGNSSWFMKAKCLHFTRDMLTTH